MHRLKLSATFVHCLCGYCLLLGAWAQVFSDPPDIPKGEFKTPRATKAKEDYNIATTKVLLDTEDRLKAARKKYTDVLNTSVKQATKSGDLKEAQLLQSAIDRMNKDETATPTGNWNATYSHTRGTFLMKFDGTGAVIADELKGRMRKEAQYWILELDQDSVIRLTADGERFFVERWMKREEFQLGLSCAYIGIAHRQEAKN